MTRDRIRDFHADDLGAILRLWGGRAVEFAARRAAQTALERAIDGSDAGGPATADYLDALRSTRATVSAEIISEFEEDITRLARL